MIEVYTKYIRNLHEVQTFGIYVHVYIQIYWDLLFLDFAFLEDKNYYTGL